MTENISNFIDDTITDMEWVLFPPENFPAQQNLMEDLSTVPPPLTVSFLAPNLVTTEVYFVTQWQTREEDPACPSGFTTFHEGYASVNYFELNGTIEEEAAEVVIDIKPGSFPNSINPKNKGVIPVAILTTATFDATTVDPLSVTFGPHETVEAQGRGQYRGCRW